MFDDRAAAVSDSQHRSNSNGWQFINQLDMEQMQVAPGQPFAYGFDHLIGDVMGVGVDRHDCHDPSLRMRCAVRGIIASEG